MARPTNNEQYQVQRLKDTSKTLCGEALKILRKKLREANVNELATIATRLLPVVINEDTQSETDLTMELLAKKALRVNIRVKEANESAVASETIEEEDE